MLLMNVIPYIYMYIDEFLPSFLSLHAYILYDEFDDLDLTLSHKKTLHFLKNVEGFMQKSRKNLSLESRPPVFWVLFGNEIGELASFRLVWRVFAI